LIIGGLLILQEGIFYISANIYFIGIIKYISNSFLGRIGIYAPLESPSSSTKSSDDFKLPDIVGKKPACAACKIKLIQRETEDQLPKQVKNNFIIIILSPIFFLGVLAKRKKCAQAD